MLLAVLMCHIHVEVWRVEVDGVVRHQPAAVVVLHVILFLCHAQELLQLVDGGHILRVYAVKQLDLAHLFESDRWILAKYFLHSCIE